MVSVAKISTRVRDCVNVNVEGSCSAWVEELNVTYGTEQVVGNNDVTDSNGDISEGFSFFCDGELYARCMPITEVQWYFEIDVDPEPSSHSFENSNTFQVLRNSAGYTAPTSTSDISSGDLIVAAVDGASPTGTLGSAFGAVSAVASGTVTLPEHEGVIVDDQRVKWVHVFARWAGSSTLLDPGYNYVTTSWKGGYCFTPACLAS